MSVQTSKRRSRNSAVNRKLPREILAELRGRAGLSGAEIARLLGKASTSGYLNYEYATHQGDRLISARMISQLIPIFVGRGTPPITREELISISDARELTPPARAAGMAVPVGAVSTLSTLRAMLPIRYRVESGVFVDAKAVVSRQYGDAMIGPTVDVDPSAQFAAVVVDSTKREVLHCIEPGHISLTARRGKRCVATVPRRGDIELVEVVVCAILPNGEAERGMMVGVVIGSYSRE